MFSKSEHFTTKLPHAANKALFRFPRHSLVHPQHSPSSDLVEYCNRKNRGTNSSHRGSWLICYVGQWFPEILSKHGSPPPLWILMFNQSTVSDDLILGCRTGSLLQRACHLKPVLITGEGNRLTNLECFPWHPPSSKDVCFLFKYSVPSRST